MAYTKEQGKKLIKKAREVIRSKLQKPNVDLIIEDKFKLEFAAKSGVFVTLTINGELRGCIGYPEPILPLYKAIVESAQNAAFNDPRFRPLSLSEFGKIKVEVTVLSRPELVKVSDTFEYLEKIKVGRDGLIVEVGVNRGLLLPQVAVDWNWNTEEFLEHTCLKAGLPKEAWKYPDARIYKFEGQIFSE